LKKSLKEAKEIEEKISLTEKERIEILTTAKKDANDIIKNANKTAEENRQN
jgi:F0F1-type ATP synthase membrane subunit b/b'